MPRFAPRLITLVPLLALILPPAAPAPPPPPAAAVRPAAAAPSPAARLHCARPGTLRLRRFEDGSARLECGRRLLARVSVPG